MTGYVFMAWLWCGLVIGDAACSAPICRVDGVVYFPTDESCEIEGRVLVEDRFSKFYRVRQLHGGCSS